MSYWSDRQDELYAKLEKEEEKLKKRIADFYRRESRKLEGKISSFYSRYGENNIIEYRKLMEKLDDDDLSLLIEAMDDFAEKYPEYAHLMPIRENIYKLNRLEGLQTSIRMQQLEIGAINNQELTDHLTKQSHRAVNTAAEALGFGKNFYSINSDVVKMFVNAVHTNGKNYSERIWGNTEKLTEYLCTDMAQAFARGDSYQNIIKHMKERFEKVSRNDMYRLIYTEGTYTMAHATMKPFEEDFEQYKISTAGDSKVCQTCRKVAEQVFNINEKVSGTNFPPFHAWCRCTWEVYVEDWNKWMDDYVKKHETTTKKALDLAMKIKPNSISMKVDYFELFNIPTKEKKALKDYISSSSYKINDKLRRNVELSKNESLFVEYLNKALDILPTYKGDVVRDLTFMYQEDLIEFIEHHKRNDRITYKEFISSTKNKTYSDEADVRIHIISKNGKDISMFNSGENEVLFKTDSVFNISKIDFEDDIIIMYMEEE